MIDTPLRLESIPWKRLLPWLHLTRAFWIAVDLRKLLLAAAGLLLISAGSLAFDRLPFGRAGAENPSGAGTEGRWPWQASLGYPLPSSLSPLTIGTPGHPLPTLLQIAGNWRIVLHPVRSMIEPAIVLFRGDSTPSALADSVTHLVWALIVWSVFGGAIARIAAVQFARDQQVGIRKALLFALERFFGFLSAPTLPLIGVAILWGLCVIGGWFGRIPGGVGDAVLGTLWGLELIFGLMMSVVLVGLTVGWPLMFATIAVEGTDGFDGLSRMYNYVFERPLYYLWQVLLALVYGSVVIFFVSMISQWLVNLTVWGVSWGYGYEATLHLIAGAPALVIGDELSSVPRGASLGAVVARGWMCGLATLVLGFVYSYFWTTATLIYFTLRRSVDANDFDEVFVEQNDEPDDLLPLVGSAAMEEADRQFPPTPIDDASGAARTSEPPPVDLTP